MSQASEYRYVSAARSKRQQKKKKKTGRVFLTLLLVLAFIAGACALTWKILSDKFTATYIKQDTAGNLVDTITGTPDEYKKDHVSILVAGISNDKNDIDEEEFKDSIGLTDIIMYVSYDVKNNKMSVLQIPRDTYIGDLTSTGKINALYAQGQYKDDPISNLAEVVNNDFQLPIDYYVTVDVKAFTEIVDLMGGIDMYVPYDVSDDEGNVLPAGNHHIDGATARWMLRQRHCYAQGDIQRMETQQYFYAACFKLFKTCSVKDLTKHVLPVVAYRVNTDMDFDTMVSLAMSLMKIDSSRIYLTRVLGGSMMVGDQSVFVVNAQRTADVLNQYFRPYGDPVSAESLPLPTGYYPSTEIEDTGKYLVNIMVE